MKSVFFIRPINLLSFYRGDSVLLAKNDAVQITAVGELEMQTGRVKYFGTQILTRFFCASEDLISLESHRPIDLFVLPKQEPNCFMIFVGLMVARNLILSQSGKIYLKIDDLGAIDLCGYLSDDLKVPGLIQLNSEPDNDRILPLSRLNLAEFRLVSAKKTQLRLKRRG
jgi:hypothetical protein